MNDHSNTFEYINFCWSSVTRASERQRTQGWPQYKTPAGERLVSDSETIQQSHVELLDLTSKVSLIRY